MERSTAAGSTAPEPPSQGAFPQVRILSASGPGHEATSRTVRAVRTKAPCLRASAPATFPRDDRYECQEDPLRLSRPWSVPSDLREGGLSARAPGGSVDSNGVGAIHAAPAPPVDPSHAASGGKSEERRGV